MFHHETTAGDIVRGILAGAIGGAVGSYAMNRLQQPAPQNEGAEEPRAAGSHVPQSKQASVDDKEEPTVQVAQMTSRKLFDHDLTDKEKQIAGPAVHYGYGMAVGALYGGLAEVWPNIKIGMGMGYGMAVWALGSEAVLPALSLAPPPNQVPMHKHADTLAAHVCFGVTLDVVRRISKIIL